MPAGQQCSARIQNRAPVTPAPKLTDIAVALELAFKGLQHCKAKFLPRLTEARRIFEPNALVSGLQDRFLYSSKNMRRTWIWRTWTPMENMDMENMRWRTWTPTSREEILTKFGKFSYSPTVPWPLAFLPNLNSVKPPCPCSAVNLCGWTPRLLTLRLALCSAPLPVRIRCPDRAELFASARLDPGPDLRARRSVCARRLRLCGDE